jgi:type I restriction enzyme S subunit
MMQTWKISKLGEYSNVIAGQSPKGEFYNNLGKGIPFYQGKKEFTDKFIGAPSTWTTSLTKEAIEGDILMSVRAPVGPVNISTQRICIGRGLAAIRVSENLNRDYLFYYLSHIQNNLSGNSGAVFDSINKAQIENIQIPLPPLPEQQRIVDILGQSFAAIDQAIENTEKNIALSQSAFENHLNNYFTSKQENWIKKPLFKLGQTQTGSTPSTLNKSYFGEFISFIKPADIDIDGFGNLNYENEKLSEHGLKVSRKISKNSILMVCIGGSIGKVGITNRNITCNQQINSLTLKEDYFPKFFYYAMRSYPFLKQVISEASQATLPIINKSKWENLSIGFPQNYSEQQKIATKLDNLLAEIKALQNKYNQKIEKLQELKQSLLHKAFNGEL